MKKLKKDGSRKSSNKSKEIGEISILKEKSLKFLTTRCIIPLNYEYYKTKSRRVNPNPKTNLNVDQVKIEFLKPQSNQVENSLANDINLVQA